MEGDNELRLRISDLQQNLVTEYVTEMKKKCDGLCAMDSDKFKELHETCFLAALNTFSEDQSTDITGVQILKQQLHLKYLDLKRENDEKPCVASVAGGAVAGTAVGAGAAAGGAAGTVVVTSTFAISATVATGGLVLVGIAAVGLGIGVGFGVKKLVNHVREKKRSKGKSA